MLSAILMISSTVICALAAETEQIGDFVYEKGTNIIINYLGDPENCTIPEGAKVKGLSKNITKVTLNNNSDWEVVAGIKGLKEVVFTDNVTEICKPNEYSTTLKKVTLSSSIEKIADSAFNSCPIEEINFKDAVSLEYIGQAAFFGTNIEGDLEFADGLKYIGKNAFRHSSKADYTLKNEYPNIILPDSVEYVDRSAFGGYSETINYPKALMDNPPEYFPNAKNITFPVSVDDLSADVLLSLRETYWYKDTYLKEKTEASNGGNSDFIISGTVLSKYVGNDENIVIPEGVTRIARFAFKQMPVKYVTLPESLREIDKSAFWGCGLEEITIPKNVETIGEGAFYECYAIKKIVFEGTPQVDILAFGNNFTLANTDIVFKDDL